MIDRLKIHRVCWSCKLLLVEHEEGFAGYSEWTPGSPSSFELRCTAGHFTTAEALSSRHSLATLLTRAADCPNYEPDPEIEP